MSFLDLLFAILIGPLKLIFEIIFVVANRFINHPGLSIIVLSLIMNFLVLPLYKRADAMQEAARDMEAKLHNGVAHIKKTFTGDERMMILQTYYRQNNYKPTDALHGSISLLLEIPFFMAAYQFLSNLAMLQGVSLGPISDLSVPDGILVVGGFSINLLPILMTLINVISSAIYLKGFPLKTKIQLYAMAAFFLVFLYGSPSGLVFYWTLNNLFSLVKTIFYKLKNPKKILSILSSISGALIFLFAVFAYPTATPKMKIALAGVGILMQYPLCSAKLIKKKEAASSKPAPQPNRRLFLLGSLFLTILVGVLIPSTFIAASPQEYVDITYYYNPLWYIANSLCLAAGTFLVWMRVFYWLASLKGKVIFDRLVCSLSAVMLINYMFFGTNLGVISSTLQYENGLSFSLSEQLINLLVLTVAAVIVYLAATRWSKPSCAVLLTVSIALGGMSVLNIYKISGPVAEAKLQAEAVAANPPSFELSKSGQNVIVLMMDRAMGELVPYLLQEKPELQDQFDGFTYYSNTISFGGYTNFGTPALYGGYEYTPVELNKRDTEPLYTKQNEALKVMPVIFLENGYDVTVCDPTYANYKWIPDLSIYDDYPEIKTFITKGVFGEVPQKAQKLKNTRRNFFCFSMMKTMPVCLQSTIYNDGEYNRAATADYAAATTQTVLDVSTATGTYSGFMESYNTLVNLPAISRITDEKKDTFIMMSNDTTHDPMLLQEPDYIPSSSVDNREYDAAHQDRFTVNGRTYHIDRPIAMLHYQANMATFIQLGNWFDYLRANGVYDNTKIIIVSDHGRNTNSIQELVFSDDAYEDVEYFYPLLMVKDFNSTGFTTSEEFMTNADVPTLAMQNLIDNPVNPFTGKAINSSEKTAHDQYIILSNAWDTYVNNGTTFAPARWASVHDNLWDRENWTFSEEETVLKEHSLP